jgi:beta-galactosidase
MINLLENSLLAASSNLKLLLRFRMLPAVGVEKEKEMETTILQTADQADRIKLTADRSELLANGQDLSFVTVEITDKNGIVQPNANNRLTFTVEGEGAIAGVGNADMKDCDPYVGNSRKTWKGRAQVIIRSNRSAGSIKLTANSPGLEETTLNIKTSSEKQ